MARVWYEGCYGEAALTETVRDAPEVKRLFGRFWWTDSLSKSGKNGSTF